LGGFRSNDCPAPRLQFVSACRGSDPCGYHRGLFLRDESCVGQQRLQTLLVSVDHRSVTSLNGEWHYLVDQSPARALDTASGEINDKSYALNEHPNIVGKHNQEYDFATAPTLRVPGDWNTQVPQLFNYEGVVWYERDFDAAPKPNSRTFLHAGAANYRSHVWVNQKRVCDHEGGYTPFDCEVTRVLHPGSNFVVIAVDATRLADGIPSTGIDWFNYGGLSRDVSLQCHGRLSTTTTFTLCMAPASIQKTPRSQAMFMSWMPRPRLSRTD
jgi:beta-galactosidase/beta-glucuronidase